MSEKTMYSIMYLFWIVMIFIYLYMAINSHNSKKKLGEKIIQNKRKFNLYMLNSGLFLILSIQRLINFINSGDHYSLLLSIALLILLPITFTKAITRPAIYENGFITYENTQFWTNIANYTLMQSKTSNDHSSPSDVTYKLVFTTTRNRKIDFFIEESDIETVQNVLDTKGVQPL